MTTLTGVPLVPGTAAGPALTIAGPAAAVRGSPGGDPRERLAAARAAARNELAAALEAVPEGPARQILRAHLALAGDPVLAAELESGLDRGLPAEEAVSAAAASLAARFAGLGSPVLRARAADLRDVCDGVSRHLAGHASSALSTAGRVVCATELSPAQVLQMIGRRPLAVVLETGAAASHAAILLRALGVPSVIGVPRIAALVRDGEMVAVDAGGGRVILDPDPDSAGAIASIGTASAPECDPGEVKTTDGLAITVTATVVDAEDAQRAMAAGADGIGLFRTEWLFLRTDSLPSEDAQAAEYIRVARLAAHRPVTMRTIDLGSDKRPPGLPLVEEPNPALGLRGVRLAYAFPDLIKTQLRALLRAFEGRRLRLLLPMVNDASDVARMRALLEEVGAADEDFEMGVMIETPAAALMADDLAGTVEFLSVGTNDLTQYVLASDRESRSSAGLYDPLHPAVLRLVQYVTTAAARRGTPVAVCGELAADPLAAPLLVGMGVSELSVPTACVARVKRVIRGASAERMRALAGELIALPTAAAVRARLHEVRRGLQPDVLARSDAR